ncbi:LHFPL tetraspan subfamily member 6 protein-like isoform X4 [Vespa velutina]|uniref:LHFPL tetraspan subfamily member 6 protein-like isoform X4 n=1 Tax=Vespa velutina TaxID=202808 RepID=UPI001FB3A4A2|nr:LHFPL tetraspan subfamily member 6 protein-like isoform X4 [Vespa velutina]
MASSSMLLTFSSARRRMRNRRSRRNRKRKRKRKRDESKGRLLGKADAYFSSFRRCNYPRIRAPNATPEIVYECARYSSFWDIPSAWWQASTVTMGIGVSIAVIGALTLLAAASSFLPHILRTPKHTRLLGSIHFIAATMICGGLVMYPIGWDNQEVRESCGKAANVYNLGSFDVHKEVVIAFERSRCPNDEAQLGTNYRRTTSNRQHALAFSLVDKL